MSKQESICESCSSFCTSSLEYLSAVSSSHTLSETVLYFSLTLLGLVCSFHSRGTSLSDYIICRYNGIIIHFSLFVKSFCVKKQKNCKIYATGGLKGSEIERVALGEISPDGDVKYCLTAI